MSRKFGLPLVALVFAVYQQTAFAQVSSKSAPDTFTFWSVSDLRTTTSSGALRRLALDVSDASPKPAFVVATGNVTENGLPDEFARLKDELSAFSSTRVGFYALPGSRDVRRSPVGKDGFARTFGKTYQAFDYGGAHFILLDSTVSLSGWGHLDKAESDWLVKDVKKLKPEAPIFLFLYHAIGREKPDVRSLDNETELAPILRGFNVIAVFTGDGAQDGTWQTNGVTTLGTKGMAPGAYFRVSVSPIRVTVDRLVGAQGEPTPVASLYVNRKTKPSQLHAGWDDPDNPFLERRRLAVTLTPRAINDNADTEMAEYRLDDGDYSAMKKDARDIWRVEFQPHPLSIGIHSAGVRLTTSNGVAYQEELIFEIERNLDEPTRKWALNLDGPVQSNPLLGRGVLYVSSLDGHLYALGLDKGKQFWSFPTKGQFLASPVSEGDLLYAGCTDHFVYALNAQNGRQKWKFDTGGPILATAGVAQDVVCVGANSTVYGLDANSGSRKWMQTVGGAGITPVVTDGRSFYVMSADYVLTALDAASGTPRWMVHLGGELDQRGPFGPETAAGFRPPVAPAVSEGRVYAVSADGALHTLDAASGTDVHPAVTPENDRFGASAPIAERGRVYLAGTGEQGRVYALDAAMGAIAWMGRIGQSIYGSSPRLAPEGGSLAIMGIRGKVAVLDTTNGKQRWSYELGPGNIFSTPEYEGGIVYTATMANDVQGINGPGVAGSPLRPSQPKASAATR